MWRRRCGAGNPGPTPTIDPSSLLGKIIAAGKVRISTDPNYAPFSSLDVATGKYVGFDTSTAEEVVKRMNAALGTNLQIEWITPSWDLITAGSWGGRWDMSIGSMSVTVGREKVVDFADPYYYDYGSIAVPTGSTVASIADLDGKNVCVGASTTYEQWLKGTLEIADPNMAPPPKNLNITSLETDNECIQALAAGRKFDAIVANEGDLANAVNQKQPIQDPPDPAALRGVGGVRARQVRSVGPRACSRSSTRSSRRCMPTAP